jgi:ComF family protein
MCCTCSVVIPKGSVFCVKCIKNIKPVCTENIFALSRYEGAIKNLILKKRRTFSQLSGDKHAARQLGQLLCELTPVRKANIDFIIPIPLHWTRYWWRGFNQSYEMGRVISKRMNVPIISALRRVKRTKFQSKFSGKQREENVKNVFVVKSKYNLCGKNVLVVDDLYTTGATMRNAVAPLVECGVKKIVVAVACCA